MPTMPGMNADVFWGDPDKPPPDWREHALPDEDDESDDPTPERKAWVCNVLGVDPSFLEDDPDGDDESHAAESTADAPLHETAAAETAFRRLMRKAAALWSKDYP